MGKKEFIYKIIIGNEFGSELYYNEFCNKFLRKKKPKPKEIVLGALFFSIFFEYYITEIINQAIILFNHDVTLQREWANRIIRDFPWKKLEFFQKNFQDNFSKTIIGAAIKLSKEIYPVRNTVIHGYHLSWIKFHKEEIEFLHNKKISRKEIIKFHTIFYRIFYLMPGVINEIQNAKLDQEEFHAWKMMYARDLENKYHHILTKNKINYINFHLRGAKSVSFFRSLQEYAKSPVVKNSYGGATRFGYRIKSKKKN
ncbi:MAG: hypothetical protein WCV85_03845 [Patescibacteria group bacterium]|jgi:hypothetical protein